jgi:hypothetical protein
VRHMVDEDLVLLVINELMKGWFLTLLQHMLFINIITVCSYYTCITNMLVKIVERQF